MRLIDADTLWQLLIEALAPTDADKLQYDIAQVAFDALDAAPTISCETCIHGDRATLNGEPTNEPNVYCGVTCLWWESFAGCNRYQPRRSNHD